MRLSVDRHRLADALKVTGALGKQSALPIFSCVLISADGDGISLTTSNLETQVTASLPCSDQKDVSDIAVSHRSLSTFVGSSKSDMIEMSVGGKGLLVDDGSAKAILPMRPAGDFDLMREDKFEECMSGDHSGISTAIDWAMKAAVGCEMDRLAMRCVCMENGKVYASNGKLLHVSEIDHRINATMDRESMKPIALTLSNADESTWSTTDTMVRIMCGSVKTIVRQVDVVWPVSSVPHIIGSEDGLIEWKCSLESITSAIKRVLQIVPNEFNAVRVSGEMVTSENRNGETATILLDGEVDCDITMSGHMFMDLTSIPGGRIRSDNRKVRYDVGKNLGLLAAMITSNK